jgi:flagellar basal body-associated protein FliL
MEEERKEVKEEITQKETKKSKRVKILIILAITLIFSLMVIGIILFVLFGDEININEQNKINSVTNVHKFSGEILFTQRAEDYTFVTEYISKDENVGDININFLYKNALVSKKVVAQDIDISSCSFDALSFSSKIYLSVSFILSIQ